MTLPPNDANYSQRLGFIKSCFSRQIEPLELVSVSRKTKRERGIWQRRFWEPVIRDELDYSRHLDYIHYNPVSPSRCVLRTLLRANGPGKNG